MERWKIPFAAAELGIVDAAVKLGDWILTDKTVTESQRAAVRTVQVCLIEGVFAPAGEFYGFGFLAERANLSRNWCVYLDSKSLEIFSIYTPEPYPHGGPGFWDMVDREDSFEWRPDFLNGKPFDVSRWIEETADPDKYRLEGFSIEIEVDDPKDRDPHVAELFRQVKVWTDANGVIHVDYPPELQAMFDAAEREERERRRLEESR